MTAQIYRCRVEFSMTVFTRFARVSAWSINACAIDFSPCDSSTVNPIPAMAPAAAAPVSTASTSFNSMFRAFEMALRISVSRRPVMREMIWMLSSVSASSSASFFACQLGSSLPSPNRLQMLAINCVTVSVYTASNGSDSSRISCGVIQASQPETHQKPLRQAGPPKQSVSVLRQLLLRSCRCRT